MVRVPKTVHGDERLASDGLMAVAAETTVDAAIHDESENRRRATAIILIGIGTWEHVSGSRVDTTESSRDLYSLNTKNGESQPENGDDFSQPRRKNRNGSS